MRRSHCSASLVALIKLWIITVRAINGPGQESRWTYETIISFSQLEKTWASGPGGPGLKRGEDNAGRSILGTRSSVHRHLFAPAPSWSTAPTNVVH